MNSAIRWSGRNYRRSRIVVSPAISIRRTQKTRPIGLVSTSGWQAAVREQITKHPIRNGPVQAQWFSEEPTEEPMKEPTYAVGWDEARLTRLVVLRALAEQGTGEDEPPSGMVFVLNWYEELKRLVPTD